MVTFTLKGHMHCATDMQLTFTARVFHCATGRAGEICRVYSNFYEAIHRLTRNTHAHSMPRAEEYPEICKLISVVTTCSGLMLGAGDEMTLRGSLSETLQTTALPYSVA